MMNESSLVPYVAALRRRVVDDVDGAAAIRACSARCLSDPVDTRELTRADFDGIAEELMLPPSS
jgi:hypothetical protein